MDLLHVHHRTSPEEPLSVYNYRYWITGGEDSMFQACSCLRKITDIIEKDITEKDVFPICIVVDLGRDERSVNRYNDHYTRVSQVRTRKRGNML